MGLKPSNEQAADGSLAENAEAFVSVEPESYRAHFNRIRERRYNKLTGNDQYIAADPHMARYIRDHAERMTNAERTGSWDTLNTSEHRMYLWDILTSPTSSSQITRGYGILLDMALAYASVGSILHNNETFRCDIISALDWMYWNRYNERKSVYGNWWDWEIGVPQILNDIMVLLYDELSVTQKQNYIRAIDHFVPDPVQRRSAGNDSFKETGANLLDKAFVVTLRGVLDGNSAKVLQGRDSMVPEYEYVERGDGIYRDGSLVQHYNIAYTGSYGEVWMTRTADMMSLLKGSPWEVAEAIVNRVFSWIENSFEPLIYKGAMMDMVRGRAISRQNSTDRTIGRSMILTLLRLCDASPPEKAVEVKRMAKGWLGQDTSFANYVSGLPIYEIGLVSKLQADDAITPKRDLTKHQVFAGMDRIVHLRPDFGFGISLFSDRISAFEYGNEENARAWFTGIGMTYLYNDDLSQFSDGFWATVNSFRLPGTTADGSGKDVTPKSWHGYYNTQTWVGGSSIDGRYGAAGMEFSLGKVTGSSLRGKKSWFSFDNEIVAMGSGITGTDGRRTETIIENRKLNADGDNILIVNGAVKPNQLGWSEEMDDVRWAHLEGNTPKSDIGYYFPESATVYGVREARTDAWSAINGGGSHDPMTRNYASLSFDHGANPSDASYAYVLLPNKDAAATASYCEKPDIKIICNTSDVHAVSHTKLGITAANFWKAGTMGFITSSGEASVMMKETDSLLTLAVSDPTQRQDCMILELDKIARSVVSRDSTVKVVQLAPAVKVIVHTNGSIGKTHTTTLELSHLERE